MMLWLSLTSQENPAVKQVRRGDLEELKETAAGDQDTIQEKTEIKNAPPKQIVWSNVKHYMNHDIFIDNGETLIIEPGTHVYVTGDYGIYIKQGGLLKARGNRDNPIIFAADYDKDGKTGEYVSNEKYEKWSGITIYSGIMKGKYNHLSYCYFNNGIDPREYLAESGDVLDEESQYFITRDTESNLIKVTGLTSLLLENCIFRNCNYKEDDLIKGRDCRMTFRDCEFRNCTGNFDFYNTILKLERTDFIDNSQITMNLASGETYFSNTNFLYCDILRFDSTRQRKLSIQESSFLNSGSDNYLIEADNCQDMAISNSIFEDIKGIELLKVADTRLKIDRSLFSDPDIGSVISIDNYELNSILIVNCELEKCRNSLLKMGSNIELYIFNSILNTLGTETIIFDAESSGCSLTAQNCVIDSSVAKSNDFYRMPTDLANNYEPAILSRSDSRDLIDKGVTGYKMLIRGKRLIVQNDFYGQAPDIGRKEFRGY